MKPEIYNYRIWINQTDPEILIQMIETWLEKTGFSVVNKMDHHFEPQGYTAMWLLKESHLAIHTFPEANKTYLELSSCNKAKNEKMVTLIQQQLEN